MLYRYLGCTVAAFFIAGIAPLSAHHSSAPHFDRDTSIELDAFVTDVKFVNPHAYVYFNVDGDAITRGDANNDFRVTCAPRG